MIVIDFSELKHLAILGLILTSRGAKSWHHLHMYIYLDKPTPQLEDNWLESAKQNKWYC